MVWFWQTRQRNSFVIASMRASSTGSGAVGVALASVPEAAGGLARRARAVGPGRAGTDAAPASIPVADGAIADAAGAGGAASAGPTANTPKAADSATTTTANFVQR